MRALSYHGPGRTTWEPVADPGRDGRAQGRTEPSLVTQNKE